MPLEHGLLDAEATQDEGGGFGNDRLGIAAIGHGAILRQPRIGQHRGDMLGEPEGVLRRGWRRREVARALRRREKLGEFRIDPRHHRVRDEPRIFAVSRKLLIIRRWLASISCASKTKWRTM